MKKKLVSALMCATMAVTMLAGCGNGSKNGTEAADGGTEAAESKVVTNTYGDSKGTHLEMWTFVELHAQHYGTMVEQWNKDHPDKTRRTKKWQIKRKKCVLSKTHQDIRLALF